MILFELIIRAVRITPDGYKYISGPFSWHSLRHRKILLIVEEFDNFQAACHAQQPPQR